VAAKAGWDGGPEAFLAQVRETWLVGTAAQLVERLGELAAVGVERVFLQHWEHEDPDPVRLVGAEVVPAVA
jgi:alkanesulfonate monooxygenase SsuD/methylene tetrahydromethanopterin reductase-like flavin-dependent oxidoreductase (luciferase family)